MKTNDFKLKSLKFSEWVEDHLNWDIKKFSIGNLNVLLSDNAQGKTRLFNVLRFLKDLHTGGRLFNNPNYRGEAAFWFEENEDDIFYNVAMVGEPKGMGLIFNETVKRNEKVLFDRSKKILIEESSDNKVSKFFMPNNVPVAAALTDKEYITINLIQDFFSRMLFLEANRFSADKLAIDKDAMALNSKGANVGCVLYNWQKRNPLAYNEVVDAFRDCFPFIENVFIKEERIAPGVPSGPLMYMKEKNIDKEIAQRDWSDGLLRALCHFVLACTQFQSESKDVIRPSFIGVDEVENGLDFNTLAKVINHYESYSSLIQTVIATHSPLVCNMLEVDKWLIMRRNGVNVKVISPTKVEDLESERYKLKKDNWEFYRRHISQSKLYRID